MSICLTFLCFVVAIYEIALNGDTDLSRTVCTTASGATLLNPTELLAWAGGFKGKVRLARNTLTNALMVLPYLTFQTRVQAHARQRI